MPGQQLLDGGAGVPGEDVRDSRRQAHTETMISDLPRHLTSVGGVGDAEDVDDLKASTTGTHDDGGSRVAEQGVSDHLLQILRCRRAAPRGRGRRLDVQACELHRQH